MATCISLSLLSYFCVLGQQSRNRHPSRLAATIATQFTSNCQLGHRYAAGPYGFPPHFEAPTSLYSLLQYVLPSCSYSPEPDAFLDSLRLSVQRSTAPKQRSLNAASISNNAPAIPVVLKRHVNIVPFQLPESFGSRRPALLYDCVDINP